MLCALFFWMFIFRAFCIFELYINIRSKRTKFSIIFTFLLRSFLVHQLNIVIVQSGHERFAFAYSLQSSKRPSSPLDRCRSPSLRNFVIDSETTTPKEYRTHTVASTDSGKGTRARSATLPGLVDASACLCDPEEHE